MAVTIRIPTTFRELTKGNSSICSDGRTLGQLLEQVRTCLLYTSDAADD